jgi:PAS domain S-box-containing protein
MTVPDIQPDEAVVADGARSRETAAERRVAVLEERLHHLDRVTLALGRARTSEEVAEVMTTVALAGMGANSGGLCLLTEKGDQLETVRLAGYPPSVMTVWKRFPLESPLPVCDAIRTRQPVVLESAEVRWQRYPDLQSLPRQERQEALVALPLQVDDRILGAVLLVFPEVRTFEPEELLFLQTLTRSCTQALERTRLLEAERRAQEKNTELLANIYALAQAERERLSAIIAEMPSGVMLLSAEAQLLLFNREAARIYDVPDLMAVPQEEFTNWSVLRPDGSPLLRAEYPVVRSLTTGETVRNEEVLLQRRDGTKIPLLANSAPLRDANGAAVSCILTFSDITHLKEVEAARQRMQTEIEHSEERSRSLVEVLTGLVWTTDGSGAFIAPQIAWERFTGQPWEEHRGLGWKQMLHPDDRARIVAAWEQTVAARQNYRIEGRLWHAASQQYRHFVAKAVPLFNPDGTIREWVGSVEDVDETKRREEEILALNARLRLAIQETHHRVKNNLQIVNAMLEVSILDAEGAIPVGDVRRISGQVLPLARVHDILTADARVDRFGGNISSRSLLERLLPMLQTTSGLQLTADIAEVSLTVQRATSLALVVNELVSNAVKYGQGPIDVTFTVSNDQGILRVRDNGPGLPPDFDFRTAANTGLMIVEQIVRHDLGGTLRLANRTDGNGAEACVTMYLQNSSL